MNYVTFSSGASRGPYACRGILKKRYRAFATLELECLHRRAAALDEVFAGKQRFEVLLQVWCELKMLRGLVF